MMLELVNGQPPNLNQPLDLVCLHILTLAAPEIDEFQWSPEMCEFVKICLVKDHYLRPGCEELLSHPFLTKEGSPDEVDKARNDFLAILTPYR